MKNDLMFQLYNKPQTVFSLNEMSLFFPEISSQNLRNRMRYFANVGKIKRLTPGIYAKADFNPFEVANKLYTPSYISLETVLAKAGIVFQHYDTIFVVSYLTREVEVNGITVQYRRLKDEILANPLGIEQGEGYNIATPERAFLDAVYLYKDYHFDNLSPLDWGKIAKLTEIYKNKTFEKRVEGYKNILSTESV